MNNNVCQEAIRDLAYQKWEQAGCPQGDGCNFWLEAEQELTACEQNSSKAKQGCCDEPVKRSGATSPTLKKAG